jgi:hypothetical protein
MKIQMLSRLPRRVVLLAALLTAAGGAAGSAAPPRSGYFQYEQTVTRTRSGPPLKTDLKLWFKGQSYRLESVSSGSKLTTLGGPNGTFAILPGGNEAMKLSGPIRQPMAGIPGLPVLDSAAVQRVSKRVGAEKVGPYKTDVYEMRNLFQGVGSRKGRKKPAQQEMTTRFWISRDLPAPVKVAVQTTGMQSGPAVTVLKAARLNLSIPDSMFRLPRGMKIRAPAPPPPR